MLNVHMNAPDFSLKNQNGQEVKLSDYLGRKVVLYFYPKDFTPGCTEQACSYRDREEDFYTHKTVVLGISQDGVESHSQFQKEHGLSFDVLADPNHLAIKAYGVWGDKVRDGITSQGVIRTTFILDENHMISEVFKDTDPKTDADRVLDAIIKMEKPIQKQYLLNNDVLIPSVGFGTWKIQEGQEAYDSVKAALEIGYRHIDTAYVYGNEKSVGQAIKDSGIPREEIFVTTKFPSAIKDDIDTKVREYFFRSLESLGLEYVDLYLIHNARPWQDAIPNYDYFDENVAIWKEMEKLYEEGYIRAIGVSNFHERDLENLLARTIVIPVINQIRFHPGHTQIAVTEFCDDHNILIEAYSPFATGKAFDSELLVELAQKYEATQAQVIMAWILGQGYLPLPKSVTYERIKENFDVFELKLSVTDMERLTDAKNQKVSD